MAKSGQITITTAGTAVQGPDEVVARVALAALSTNTGPAYVGNDEAGDVSAANGFPLNPLGPPLIIELNNLRDLWFDATTNGNKICWIKLN